jgi:hypothetical protein
LLTSALKDAIGELASKIDKLEIKIDAPQAGETKRLGLGVVVASS